jgi:hypothetical protein
MNINPARGFHGKKIQTKKKKNPKQFFHKTSDFCPNFERLLTGISIGKGALGLKRNPGRKRGKAVFGKRCPNK